MLSQQTPAQRRIKALIQPGNINSWAIFVPKILEHLIKRENNDPVDENKNKPQSEPNNVHSLLKFKLLKYLDQGIMDTKKNTRGLPPEYCEGVIDSLKLVKNFVLDQAA